MRMAGMCWIQLYEAVSCIFVCGIGWAQFSSGKYVQSYLICLPIWSGVCIFFFLALWYICCNSMKKKEWICSVLWFYHNSSSRVAITHFLHLGLCFSTSVIFIQAGFSQLFHMLIRQLMIEMEPLTFTIVVHSKSKAKGFKYYQRCIIKNVSCLCWQSASVPFQSLGRVRPLVPLKQWCKGLS